MACGGGGCERNTPTPVGKTRCHQCFWKGLWKHPHACGEDTSAWSTELVVSETPPRLWGRRYTQDEKVLANGNTPTPVGKTHRENCRGASGWKHPHACGEDLSFTNRREYLGETPPRLWGRQRGRCHGGISRGNTPTPVGKTFPIQYATPFIQKHPHACGEDARPLGPGIPGLETPPRLWGRRQPCTYRVSIMGNTPTPVGKTSLSRLRRHDGRKHPHACGEDIPRWPFKMPLRETPPRLWGRHQHPDIKKCNTSRCSSYNQAIFLLNQLHTTYFR